MLAHALRRFLWTIPALIGVSLVTFLFLSYVPDPTDDPAFVARTAPAELERLRRERFLDLPRLFNANPRDVRSRAEEAILALSRGGPDADEARRELVRLGGAALPHLLPRLDALDPESRKLTVMMARWLPATGRTAVILTVSVPVPNTLLSTA